MDITEHGGPGVFFNIMAKRIGVPMEQMEQIMAEYTNMRVLYKSAIREVSTRLEILDDEFQFKHKRNPIHSIQTRMKSPKSIVEKLERKNISPSVDAMRSSLTDIAGIRVICCYVDDIYMLSKLLCEQEGVELVRINDYIKYPKPNGYRSLHVVVRVPVHFSDGQQKVPVEIQIRTIAMDFWASLEHELRYKAAANIPVDIVQELSDCADDIAQLDARMQLVYHQLEEIENEEGLFAPQEGQDVHEPA